MKHLKTIFIFLSFLGCQKQNNQHWTIGTWNNCKEDGSYWEYKITPDYFMMISSKFQGVWIFKNETNDSLMMLTNLNPKKGLLFDNDTLMTLSHSQNQGFLKSKNTSNIIELNKVELDFNPIDSTNFDNWENKTISEFNKRAESRNCLEVKIKSDDADKIIILPKYIETEINIESFNSE